MELHIFLGRFVFILVLFHLFILIKIYIYFSCRILNSLAREKGEAWIKVYPTMTGVRRFSLNLMWSQCHLSRSHHCWLELMVVAFWAMPLIFISVVSIKHSLIMHLLRLIEDLDLCFGSYIGTQLNPFLMLCAKCDVICHIFVEYFPAEIAVTKTHQKIKPNSIQFDDMHII